MFYGLKPEINAFIHSFIHNMSQKKCCPRVRCTMFRIQFVLMTTSIKLKQILSLHVNSSKDSFITPSHIRQ